MKLEEFNKKYREGKKDKIFKACQEAVLIMENSLDSVHDIRHVENMLSLIDIFLQKHDNLRVNFDVLLLSVCWHDAWIARKQRNGFLDLSFQRLVEGVASSLLFKKRSTKYRLSKKIVKEVCYAIRKHSSLQFTRRKTIEAKLLDDADKTDARNYHRIENSHIEKRLMTKKLYLKITLFYLNHIDQRINYPEHLPVYEDHKSHFLAYVKARM